MDWLDRTRILIVGELEAFQSYTSKSERLLQDSWLLIRNRRHLVGAFTDRELVRRAALGGADALAISAISSGSGTSYQQLLSCYKGGMRKKTCVANEEYWIHRIA